ncbi:hydroxyethylthiazole kinase [Arthrobacter sp. SX1312]|uniref:hydroxyethylthiazole kinase n=1 Tax=Arthrobacter sp. SX1312 TaxID=2058896 RepID=UPI0015E205B6|nr:hydroxyethylthiazole kinase [Arthrobacter sp. SX1312]
MSRMAIRFTSSDCAALLEELRARSPLVQSITNAVVTNFTANVLLAIGAAPAMVDIPEEAGQFASVASGVLINLGTPGQGQEAAMQEAVQAANAARTPWVLDPVAIGSLTVRTKLAHQLAAHRPSIIRGNASEILALAGVGSGGRGVDSTEDPISALEAATQLSASTGSAVAVSGPVDLLVGQDGRTVSVANGHSLLTRVTGGGCALGAVMAAFASLTDDSFLAATAATGAYTIAAEQAATQAQGPGSFAVGFLDRLATITPEDIITTLNLRPVNAPGNAR